MSKKSWLAVPLGTAAAVLVMTFLTVELSAQSVPLPQFKVDPYWPKPLPQEKDAQGQMRRWFTGGVGGVCVDSHDHIYTTNRGGRPSVYEGYSAIVSPYVIVYNTAGDVINSWGKHREDGSGSEVLPELAHGCFVDYEDNVWITGTQDGLVLKYDHDGKKILLTIGVKGQCDGPPDAAPKARHPTCGEKGSFNSSKTLLNQPPNLWVDPAPDPVTGERGSVYIADGYGNHRVVVFDRNGKFLRQWGTPGKGPGQFGPAGEGFIQSGGHPHCVALSKDGLLYACDRINNRIFEFDRVGNLKRTIPVDPPGGLTAPHRTGDLTFSTDPQQTYMYDTDIGNNVVRILNRASGQIVGQIGVGPGRQAGSFVTPHQIAVDSKGNVYVSETIDSNRVQRFIKQ